MDESKSTMKVLVGNSATDRGFVWKKALTAAGLSVTNVHNDRNSVIWAMRHDDFDCIVLDGSALFCDIIKCVLAFEVLCKNPEKIIIALDKWDGDVIRGAMRLGVSAFSVDRDLTPFVTEVKRVCRLGNTAPGVDVEINKEITDILNKIGIPSGNYGYLYLQTAIGFAVKDPLVLNRTTKDLYPAVANMHNTTWNRVERAIRYAIHGIRPAKREAKLDALIGDNVYVAGKKIRSVDFIGLIANRVRQDLNL